jgi:hypothetical protein
MDTERHRIGVAAALVVGALLGMAGTFAPTDQLRALAWGIDGTALVVASALLVVYHMRQGNDTAAAGFLVFLAGETLIVSGSAMSLEASAPTFAAGAALWSAALGLISVPRTMPAIVRATGALAAVLFAVTAVRMFNGASLTPLTQPLPFFAYPALVVTLLGWAWAHVKSPSARPVAA